MQYARELEAALEAVRRAGEVILRAYGELAAVKEARANVTTETDRASQEAILAHLRATFPGDRLCAEEETATLASAAGTGPRLWIVDPIDGTRGFVTKNGEFSAMVGLFDGERLIVGVVYEPATDRLTYAVRGGGCWRKDGGGAPVRCAVTTVSELSSATLVQSHSKGKPSAPVLALKPRQVRETYSAGLKLALVARGEVDLYVNTYNAFHDWDIAAGQILVEEAGGQVTGLRGETLRYGTEGAWQRAGVLATNGRLHAAAIAGMKDMEF
jgi:3'(2'), 5'-bisphosphate nucleotidase